MLPLCAVRATFQRQGKCVAFWDMLPSLDAQSAKKSSSLVSFIIYVILNPGTDPGFREGGFVCINVWGVAMLILSQFS